MTESVEAAAEEEVEVLEDAEPMGGEDIVTLQNRLQVNSFSLNQDRNG